MNDDNIIKEGYCLVVKNFVAYCVPFKTRQVDIYINSSNFYETIKYTVELPNGEEKIFDERELKYTEEQIQEFCKTQNDANKDTIEFWNTCGISTLLNYKAFEDESISSKWNR